MKITPIWRVFIAIFLAVIAGSLTGKEAELFDINLVQLYGSVGKFFLNALTLIVVPMVCSSIIVAMARMGSDSSFRSLGAKSIFYFVLTTVLAMLAGYLFVILIHPGGGLDAMLTGAAAEAKLNALQSSAEQSAYVKIEQLILRLVPTNIIEAAAHGQMLGLISFCTVFGYFLSKIDKEPAALIVQFFNGIFQIMMKITQFVMKWLPIGVFALVAKVVAVTGIDTIKSVAAFFGVVLLSLAVTCTVIFPMLVRVIGRTNPFTHFKAMLPAVVTAFSTSSSAATMPVTIECLEKKAGVSPRICNFFIPFATAINMPGTALHVCVAVFFIAQSYGVELTLLNQGLILLMTLFTSFGVAGVPSGSLFAIVTVLTMVGLPSEGVLLTLAVERLLDMTRTAANVYSNSCCALFLAAGEEKVIDVTEIAPSTVQ